ncbi:hypothetical protein TEA_010520 [Camellia sinensis var. sinensis]|uniref:Lon proteolytic domain-containing protein n=1 Tax=Camellia sinensis var. sinensis TaxID=542762 RepID=A0A4S4EI90_CAMSN|nr:hypothetical protein TEA_010520 [Camellia sinensis var. sinensis]
MRCSALDDKLGTPFDGTPFYGLGTPFERLGTPFEGTTFEGSISISMYIFWAAYIHTHTVSSTPVALAVKPQATHAQPDLSFLEFPIPNSVAFIGEIGLGGELRPVSRMEKRLNTVVKLGYKKCIVPKSTEKPLAAIGTEGTAILGCRNLKEMINTVFTANRLI